MNQIILYVMAVGAVIGGIDHMLGNRWGFGARFEEAFRLLGPIGLSMAGIICLAPALSQGLGRVVVPLFTVFGLDPGIFGSILAIDMGGYQMAMDLAADPAIGRFSGIIVSAIFGCTVVFTIPVGLGAVREADRPFFTRGILLGLVSMPAGILAGGLAFGLSAGTILVQTLPILLISAALFIGLIKAPQAVVRGFGVFARGVQALASLGLTLGAVQVMTGFCPLVSLTPLTEAMETVCAIGIVMLGSMPLAELVQRLMKAPFRFIGRRTGLNEVSTTGLLIGLVSVTPALAMIPRMDERGKVLCGASVVCGASAFSAHLGFALSAEPEMAAPLLLAKLLGCAVGVVLALAATRREMREAKKGV